MSNNNRKRKRDNRSTTTMMSNTIINLGIFLICFEIIRLCIIIGFIETTLFAQNGFDIFIDTLVTNNNRNNNLRISHHHHQYSSQQQPSFIKTSTDTIVDVCIMERHNIEGMNVSLDGNVGNNNDDQSITNKQRNVLLSSEDDNNNNKKSNLKMSKQQQQQQQQQQRHPKVAICIRGDDRGIDNAYNMYKTLIEPLYEPDIFAVIHSNMYDPNHPMNKRKNNNTSSSTYEQHNMDHNNDINDHDNNDNIPLLVRGLMNLTNQYPNNNNMKQPIRMIDHHYYTYSSTYILNELTKLGMNYTLWYKHSWSSYINRLVGVNALGPIFTHGSAFYQYKDLYNCNQLITKNENRHKFQYDYIIIVRSDQWCLHSPLYNTNILQMISTTSSTKLPNRIYIPSGEDWWGTNDRFIIIPRQYSTYFLTQPYMNLYQNINTNWYSLNMETVVNHTLSSIIQNSAASLTSSLSLCPAASIVRTDPVCFLACQYEESSLIPLLSSSSSSTSSSSHQSKDSWKACSSPTDHITLSSSPAWEILFGSTFGNEDVSLHDYAKGYNGYKYIHEYVAVLHNAKKIQEEGII